MIDEIKSAVPTVTPNHNTQVVFETIRRTGDMEAARVELVIRCLDRLVGIIASDKRSELKRKQEKPSGSGRATKRTKTGNEPCYKGLVADKRIDG